MPGRGNDHRPAAIAHHSEWAWVQRPYVRVVASGDCSGSSDEILDDRPLQILRLEPFSTPSAGAGAVVAKCAADPIVCAGTGEQRVDLLHRRLGAADPELQHTLHRCRQLFSPLQLPLDRGLIQFL